MWQERWNGWIGSLRARLAKKRRESSPRDDGGLDNDHETIAVGGRRHFDLRRSALRSPRSRSRWRRRSS